MFISVPLFGLPFGKSFSCKSDLDRVSSSAARYVLVRDALHKRRFFQVVLWSRSRCQARRGSQLPLPFLSLLFPAPAPLRSPSSSASVSSASPECRDRRTAWRAAAGTASGSRRPVSRWQRGPRPSSRGGGRARCSGARLCRWRTAEYFREKNRTNSWFPLRAAPPPVRCRSVSSRRAGSAPRARIAPCRARPAGSAAPFPRSRGSPGRHGASRCARGECGARGSAGVRPQPSAFPRGIDDRDGRCGDPCCRSQPSLFQRRVCCCTFAVGFVFFCLSWLDSWRIVCDLIVILFHKPTKMLQYLLTGTIYILY